MLSQKVTTGVLISQKFTTGCMFFCISRRGEKVSLNILRRVFLILRGKSQNSKVTKQWVWKPIKVEKERSYLQPTVRDVIAMRKTSAMYPLPDIPSLPRNIVPIESPSISTLKQVRSRFSSDHSKSTLQIKTAIFKTAIFICLKNII